MIRRTASFACLVAVLFTARGFAQEHSHEHETPATQEQVQYNVGDPMPDYTIDTTHAPPDDLREFNSNCQLLSRAFFKNDNGAFIGVAFPSFEAGALPYGIFYEETFTLLLDTRKENGENGPDGIIDLVVTGEDVYQHSREGDHPYCGNNQ